MNFSEIITTPTTRPPGWRNVPDCGQNACFDLVFVGVDDAAGLCLRTATHESLLAVALADSSEEDSDKDSDRVSAAPSVAASRAPAKAVQAVQARAVELGDDSASDDDDDT